ncbi:Glyco_trans_2-like domain-containing protein [Gammaproteobacteria bacterium]
MSSMVVSCIIPVWNGERFLDQALDSVFAQTRPPDEIIVVDDGSTDGSAATARGRGRVRLIQQVNGGVASARNAGVQAANGDMLAFLDADDLWLPTKLERQLGALAIAATAGGCVTLIDTFTDTNLGEGTIPTNLERPRPGYIASTLMVRRQLWERIGPMDETMPIRAEFEWFARLKRTAIEVVEIAEVLARRRLHRDNTSRRFTQASIDAAFVTIARHRGRKVAPL